MGINTIYPVICPIDGKKIDMDECFVRCSAATYGCPEKDMPGINSFETEREICKKCRHYVNE